MLKAILYVTYILYSVSITIYNTILITCTQIIYLIRRLKVIISKERFFKITRLRKDYTVIQIDFNFVIQLYNVEFSSH